MLLGEYNFVSNKSIDNVFCGDTKRSPIIDKPRFAFHAYYDFERIVAEWENRLSMYSTDSVPVSEQNQLLDDLIRMLKSDAPLPYHYSDDKLQAARTRVISLLDHVDDSVILAHPDLDSYHAHFFISQKSKKNIRITADTGGYQLYNQDHLIAQEDRLEIVISHVRLNTGKLYLTGYIKSVLFNYLEKPSLFLCINNNPEKYTKISLDLSSWSYHRAKIITNHFWLFECEINLEEISSFFFRIKTQNEIWLDTKLSYHWQTPFYRINSDRYSAVLDNYSLHSDSGTVIIDKCHLKGRFCRLLRYWKKPKVWISRLLAVLPNKKLDRCWLYHDCTGHPHDNGYFQFIHDIRMNDGVYRYYVLNEADFKTARSQYPAQIRKQLIRFGSFHHKLLYLKADKILTAFAELENYFPFNNGTFGFYKDVCSQHELVYLQHGVLHAHTPWKYSRDRLNVDKEVVSTYFEKNNLMQNYHFRAEDLILCGMPRYDHISCERITHRRILFAPSWRKNTLSFERGQWVPSEQQFLDSLFFRETQSFLNSPAVHELLEKYDYYLDFKLHPLMSWYRNYYQISSPRINILDRDADESSYDLFISDFSSYTFDFVYQKKPIIYFFPDRDQFLAGMNSYRELDLPYEEAFGDMVQDLPGLVQSLQLILENKCEPLPKYLDRMNHFFFYYDNHQCDRLYRYLAQSECEVHDAKR